MPPLVRSLTARIVLGMVLGAALGVALGRSVDGLGEAGKLLVQAIKVFATPLLFFAILDAVLTTEIRGRHAGRMLGVAFTNAAVALAIGLLLSNLFQVGHHVAPLFAEPVAPGRGPAMPATPPPIDFGRFLSTFVPTSVVQPFAENLAITIIGLALLLGFALRRVRREEPFADGVARIVAMVGLARRITEVILGWVIHFIPLAVFAVVAQAVGRSRLEALHRLGYYVALGLGGLALHVLVTHHAWLLYLRRPIRAFWAAARAPVVYAFGANSSLATLPVTMAALDRLGVSRQSSTLGACVGTNFNNDGILLYEAMAAIMVAQALGHDLPLAAQLGIAGLSLIAAMGIAGVPEAGFISLALVLTTVGLPIESLPVLLSVDWIIARGRSAVNVLSDMVVSLAIEGRRVEGEPRP